MCSCFTVMTSVGEARSSATRAVMILVVLAMSHPPAAVVVKQHLPGVRVHQHGGRGAGGHAPHPHRRQAPPQRQPHQQPRPFSQ